MTWKNRIALSAIVPRRRLIASALIYGLSLSVRLTSATGEQVEAPLPAAASIATRDTAPTFYKGWSLKLTEPMALLLGRPPITPRCHTACERYTAKSVEPTCGGP
jgi:hypothetical protein